MAFKAVAEQTGGDFSLMERTMPPGAGTPPPHRHVTCRWGGLAGKMERSSCWPGRSRSGWTTPS
jgi:hypothetical protein